MKHRPLACWTSAEVAATRPILTIPVGSCEQHGPHLPLATDTIIAVALAERLVERLVVPAVVAPALAITSSGEHAGFPGTLSIGASATATAIVELARSADWTAGIVLVNGHGGNAAAVAHAVATIGAEGRHIVSWWPTVGGGDAHAGRTETSLMLAIQPDLVHMGRAVRGDTRPLHEIASDLRGAGVGAVSPTGVLGDPTDATLEEGRDLLDTLTADLVATVDSAHTTW